MNIGKNIKDIIFNGSSTLVLKVVGLILNYLVLVFITKNYGSNIYGKYALSVSLTQIIAVFFSMGFPILVMKMIADKNHFDSVPKTDFLQKKTKLLLIVGFLVSLVLFLSSKHIATYIFKDIDYENYLKTLSFFVIPVLFNEFFLGYFKGVKQFTKHNVFLFILPPILFFISFLILKEIIFSGLLTFVCFLVSILCISAIQLFFYFKSKKKTITLKKTNSKQLLKTSLPMMYSGLLLFLLSLTDIFMIEAIKTSTDVGIYSAAFKVASLGFIFITAINVVIAPKIADLFHKNEIKELHITMVKSTRLITMLTLPLVLFLIVFRGEIMSFFGQEFVYGQKTLVYILLGILYSAMCGTADQVLNMTNNQKVLRNIVIFSFFLNVVLNYLLIPTYSINGAAIASLATNIVLNSLCVFYIKRRLGFYTFM